MKRSKYKDWVWRISLIIFALCVIEGCVYYQGTENKYLMHAFIFQNAIKAYKIDPDIKLKDAYTFCVESDTEGIVNTALSTLTVIYSIAVLIAPFCTVALLLTLAEKTWARICAAVKRKKGARILVIGDGEYYDNFVKNLAKTCKVTTCVSNNMPEQDVIELIKSGVNAIRRYGDEKKSIYEELSKRGRLDRFDCFLLCSSSGVKNLEQYDKLLASVKEREDKKTSGGKKTREDEKTHEDGKMRPVYLYAENEASAEIVRAYDSNHQNRHLYVTIVDPKKTVVNQILCGRVKDEKKADKKAGDGEDAAQKNKEIYKNTMIHTNRSATERDVHMGIIGFGEFGQDMLVQGLNMAVVSTESTIRVDVFDKRMSNILGTFMKRFAPEASDMIVSEEIPTIGGKVKGYTLVLGDEGTPFEMEGSVELHFWETDTQRVEFNQTFSACHKNMNFTYIVIATSDISSISAGTIGVMDMLKRDGCGKNIPIVVRTKDNIAMDIICENDKENNRDDFNIVSVDQDVDIFSFEGITEAAVVDEAKRFNCIYGKIYNEIYTARQTGQDIDSMDMAGDIRTAAAAVTAEDIERDWNLMMYKRESSVGQSMHQVVKKWLLDVNGAGCTIEHNAEELMRIEHRRWEVFMITHGYKYGPSEGSATKDTAKKTHTCIVNWKHMDEVEKVKDTKIYDLVPYEMLQAGE